MKFIIMKNQFSKYLSLLLPLMLLAGVAKAQVPAEPSDSTFYDNFLATTLIVVAGAVVIATVATLFKLLSIMIKMQQIRIYQEQGLEEFLQEVKKPKESIFQRLYKRMTESVPVEKEKDILFEHEFDGIRELDNNLPPWWVALFYISIAFGVVYFSYYHILGYGNSSREQYEQEIEQAQEAVAAYLAKQADSVDETNVTMVEDESLLSMGESIFQANCAACHGSLGEGGVGPNLTDRYWVHGGSIKDVFKTIKYGVPEKGMISWKSQLRASDMQRVSSYIMTLVGTSPPNAKEPEGELYQAEQAEPAQDTTATEPGEAIGMNKN